jgi:hypothetical protein
MSDAFERIADDWDAAETKNVYQFDERRFSDSIEEQARKIAAKANGHAPAPKEPARRFSLTPFADIKIDQTRRDYLV